MFQSLPEVLDDLTVRFIINCPKEELTSIQRVVFQIEQAHWFYEDFVREVNPSLGSYSLKKFSTMLFVHCPLLNHWAAEAELAYSQFLHYKVRVPTCGAILLNSDLTQLLLVRGWRDSASWSFPKGKINKQESEVSCAIREVYEETGFDISPHIRVNEYVQRTISDQRIKLYIVAGIPNDTQFVTQTRKEIGDIKWHPLAKMPGYSSSSVQTKIKLYLVTSFMGALKQWVSRFKKAKKLGRDRDAAHLKVVMGVDSGDESDAQESDGLDSFARDDQYQVSKTDVTHLESSIKTLLGISPSQSQKASDPLDSVGKTKKSKRSRKVRTVTVEVEGEVERDTSKDSDRESNRDLERDGDVSEGTQTAPQPIELDLDLEHFNEMKMDESEKRLYSQSITKDKEPTYTILRRPVPVSQSFPIQEKEENSILSIIKNVPPPKHSFDPSVYATKSSSNSVADQLQTLVSSRSNLPLASKDAQDQMMDVLKGFQKTSNTQADLMSLLTKQADPPSQLMAMLMGSQKPVENQSSGQRQPSIEKQPSIQRQPSMQRQPSIEKSLMQRQPSIEKQPLMEREPSIQILKRNGPQSQRQPLTQSRQSGSDISQVQLAGSPQNELMGMLLGKSQVPRQAPLTPSKDDVMSMLLGKPGKPLESKESQRADLSMLLGKPVVSKQSQKTDLMAMLLGKSQSGQPRREVPSPFRDQNDMARQSSSTGQRQSSSTEQRQDASAQLLSMLRGSSQQ